MRIDVTYAGEAPRVIETSGEAMLSSSVVSLSGGRRDVAAVMLRPRLDLLGRGGRGLAVEVCYWDAGDEDGPSGEIADFAGEWSVPRLRFHTWRVWEVLSWEEASRALAIDIDGRIHLRRIEGRLLDLTAFECLERTLLSSAEVQGRPLRERVRLVHSRIRLAEGTDLTDAQIGSRYGLGTALADWAGLEEEDKGKVKERGGGVDDGLGDVVARIAGAHSRDDAVRAVTSAMLDHGADLNALRRACKARGVDARGLAALWSEAERALDDFD